MAAERIFAADLVLPVAAPPVRDGAVLVHGGRIVAVGPLSELRKQSPDAEISRFPDSAIVPGAVNAHAHLGFRREDAPEGGTFAGWLTQLIERLPEKESWTAEAAKNSAREAIEAGTTCMAESSPYGECLPQLAQSGMAGVAFAEFFPGDFPETEPEERVEAIFEKVYELRKGLPERIEVHVSVHSPYTVDPDSARLAARRTRDERGKLAIHLSESPEEVEFVLKGTGGLSDIFGRNEWGGAGIPPVKYAESIGMIGPEVTAAHLATGVDDEALEILARSGVAVAHCPRSNEYLGCEVSPVPDMMRRGIRVGMGTDGLWSSPSMNLFEETLFAVKLHGFDGATGLRLAALEGARALGVDDETGSLQPGKWADLAAVESTGGEMEVLEAAAGGGVVATVAGGRVLYNRRDRS